MSQKENKQEDEINEHVKANRRKLHLIISLLIIIIILLLLNCCMYKERIQEKFVIDCNSEAIDIPKPHIAEDGSEMTEIIGYENTVISAQNPNVYIVNAENNTVYLQYDIYKNDELIYSTDLIPPNRMVEVEVYSKLAKGNQELVYMIDTYDLKTKEECTSNIKQIVKVNVE